MNVTCFFFFTIFNIVLKTVKITNTFVTHVSFLLNGSALEITSEGRDSQSSGADRYCSWRQQIPTFDTHLWFLCTPVASAHKHLWYSASGFILSSIECFPWAENQEAALNQWCPEIGALLFCFCALKRDKSKAYSTSSPRVLLQDPVQAVHRTICTCIYFLPFLFLLPSLLVLSGINP